MIAGRLWRTIAAATAPAVLGAFLLLGALPAAAQVPGGGITFQGPATNGDCPQIVSQFVQKDSGSPCGSGGSGVSSFSAGTTGFTPSSGTTGAVTLGGTLGFANGGTGFTGYTDGQLLIGNTATGGLSKATITAGTNITVTNGNGTITIAASGGGSGCSTSGSSGNVLTDNGSGGCASNADLNFATGTLTLGTNTTEGGVIKLFGPTSGNLSLKVAATAGTNSVLTFPGGTTDFSATGGTSEVVQQVSAGAAFTVGQLACGSLSNAGTACQAATGTSGATVPLLNGANTWSGVQTFSTGDLAFANSSGGKTTLAGAASASNFTATFPAATGTVAMLGAAQTFTAVQTFTNSDLKLLGSSTGATTFTSANSTTSNFTLTIPAATDTMVTLAATQTLTNKTLTSPTFGGTVAGANTIPLSILAQAGANTVLGNGTGATANVTALSVGGCSGATNALTWTSGIGFGCNTISGGAYWNNITISATSPITASNLDIINATGTTAQTVNLPVGSANERVQVWALNTGANVTVTPNGTDKIYAGAGTSVNESFVIQYIGSPGAGFEFDYDGTAWRIKQVGSVLY